ncbi:MAG: DUF4175 family protein [Oceanicaulis sp.]
MMRRTPILLARAALLWERAAPLLIGPALAIGLYAALALYGVFEVAGDPWRAIALFLALAASAAAIRLAWPGFSLPTEADAERRVERDSGLRNRPYEALRDAPVAGEAGLWAAHRARMAERLAGARARRPEAAWARLDRYGVRVSLIVIVIAGAGLAGDLAWPRLKDSFAPRILAGGGLDASVEFWVEPPAYTGRPVLYLRDRRTAEIPEGSILSARITGLRRDPTVSGAPYEVEALSEDVRQVAIRPEADGPVTLRAGALRDRIALTIIEDTPPDVRLAAEPEGDAQGRLILEFAAEDDYGIETFVLEYAAEPQDGGQPQSFETLALAPGAVSPPGEDGLRTATIDLARSELAGERAVIRMAALDGAGQRGVSGPLALTLPQRVFLDPLARAVAYERKRFIGADADYAPMPEGVSNAVAGGFMGEEPERRIERAPAEARRLAAALDAVSDAPASYFDDPIVWMGLRTAMREVRRAREMDDLDHLDEDLWQIALRAELGSLADAEEALRAAERALLDAMARGADAMELSALFDAYEQAVSRYMQALAREALEEGRFAEGGGGGGSMSADRLQALLDALREAAELGDTEGSRQALAQLQELLENLQMTLGGGGEGEGGPEGPIERALREALEELGDQIGEQRSIMEDTFEQAREGEGSQGQGSPGQGSQGQGSQGQGAQGAPAPGQPGAGGMTGAEPGSGGEPGGFGEDRAGQGGGGEEGGETGLGLAERQAAIEEGLGGLEDAMGEAASPEARAAIDAARQAMQAARQALDGGDLEGALEDQDRAVAALREAARASAERLEQARGGRGGDGQTDPLGRASGAGPNGEGTETGVPGEAERQRAREILEELRRRAAERGRPQDELDYIDRLLERF